MTVSRRDAVVAATALVVACALVAALAPSAQPWGDDFCYGVHVGRSPGWLDFVRGEWRDWSGRWTANALRYPVYAAWGAGGFYVVTVLVSLLAIVAGAFVAVRFLYPGRRAAAVYGALAAPLFLSLASDLTALVFWRTPLFDYTVGYLLVPVAIATAVRAADPSRRGGGAGLVTAALLVALSTGLSELFLFPVFAALAVIAIGGGAFVRLAVLVAAATAGAALNLLAPGQIARAAAETNGLALWDIGIGTVKYGLRTLLLPAMALYLVSWLPVVGDPVSVLARRVRGVLPRRTLVSVAAAVIAYPFFTEFVLFWALGAPGPGRAHNLPVFTLVLGWPLLAAIFPWLAPTRAPRSRWRHGAAVAAALVILVGVNYLALVSSLVTGEARAYGARIATVRAGLAKAASGEPIEVTLPESVPAIAPGPFLDVDPGSWVNRCVARYYGLASVQAAPAVSRGG